MPGNPASPSLPPTCAIRGLVAFGPGWHKGELYTDARCRQVAANFAATGGRPLPLAKIGHDKQQRFARSLGFPNVGVVTRCAPIPGTGCFEVDIEGVPTEVGGKVNAGRLRGASVELKSQQRDPRDPSRELPGDVLTGISLLGEEQPAVQNWPEHLRAKAVPRATFADGTAVPPDHEMSRWLDLAAEVSDDLAAEAGAEFSADRRTVRIRGREFRAAALCFSDFETPTPDAVMTPEQESALAAAGFTPEQIAQMKAALGTAPQVPPTSPTGQFGIGGGEANRGAMEHYAPRVKDEDGDTIGYSRKRERPHAADADAFAAACKKYADDPDATPEQKMMARMYADMQELRKRTGELQAAADAAQKKDAEAQMAAFSDQVAKECLKIARKVEPKVVEGVIKPTALGILTSKSFSAEADRVKAFSDYFAGFAALPDDPRLSRPVGTAGGASEVAPLSASGRKVLDALKDVSPRVHARHTAPAA